MPFTPIGNGKYKSPSGRVFTSKQVKAYYATNGFTKHKAAFRVKRKVDNKMRDFGDFNEKTNTVRINKKMAKKSPRKGELLDTIVHEEYHVRNPKATEKTTYKKIKQIKKKLTPKVKAKLYGRYK